jgi:hypothetical protein
MAASDDTRALIALAACCSVQHSEIFGDRTAVEAITPPRDPMPTGTGSCPGSDRALARQRADEGRSGAHLEKPNVHRELIERTVHAVWQ